MLKDSEGSSLWGLVLGPVQKRQGNLKQELAKGKNTSSRDQVLVAKSQSRRTSELPPEGKTGEQPLFTSRERPETRGLGGQLLASSSSREEDRCVHEASQWVR